MEHYSIGIGGKKEFISELTVFRSLLDPRLPLSDTPFRTSRTRRHQPERVLGLGEEIRLEHYKRRKAADSEEINSHSVPGRNRTLFRCVFRLHHRIGNAISLNFR